MLVQFCTCDRTFQSHLSGVMGSMFALSAVYRGFLPWSGQIKDFIEVAFATSLLSTQD